jgi:hypothetical protein
VAEHTAMMLEDNISGWKGSIAQVNKMYVLNGATKLNMMHTCSGDELQLKHC